MTAHLIGFFTYLIEIFSFLFLAFKALDKRLSPSFSLIGSAFCVSLFSSLMPYWITSQSLIYLLQFITYLFYYKFYFRLSMRTALYLDACVFSIEVLLQLLLALPIYLNPELLQSSYAIPFTLLIAALISFFLYLFAPLQRFFQFILNAKLSARLLFVNLYLIVVSIVLFSRLHTQSFFQLSIILLLCVFSLFCVNLDMFYTHFKLQRVEAELESYHKYLPIVEGLIADVRAKQHNFDNAVQSFAALPLTCTDYESLTAALEKYSRDAFQKNLPSELLKLNYKLVAGFLHVKESEALKQGKFLHITIKNYVLQTTLPEYTLTECIGVLLDNALEAVPEDTILPVSIDSQNGKVLIEVTNPGPYIDDALLKKMFQSGYTTKNVNPEAHGLGLTFLYDTVKKYQGAVICLNHKQNGENYITFKLEV